MQKQTQGWINGFTGVVIFSISLPATRIAVLELDPFFLTFARASIAALLGLFLLGALRQSKPKAADLPALFFVSIGVVFGYPLLSAMALQHISSAHSLVFVGLLPLATAVFALLRGGERPRAAFWLFSLMGATLVTGFALWQDAGSSEFSLKGDLLMLAAILICGLGYAEGARLARTLGGWQVISWALLLSLPLTLPATLFYLPRSFASISTAAWLGLFYVALFSMLIGFIFWYRGLALGGIAAVGQIQYLQPFIGFAFAAMLLNEPVHLSMLLTALGAVVCVFFAKKHAG